MAESPEKAVETPRQIAQLNPLTLATEEGTDAFYTSGRRGVRLFGLPPNSMVMATTCFVLVGVPLSLMIASAPFWERFGDTAAMTAINGFIAPSVATLTSGFRVAALPHFPFKRFLVATECMALLLILGNLVALFCRGVRRHALLVWLCYDRKKFTQQLSVAALLCAALWYVFFIDWRVLVSLASGRHAFMYFLYFVVALPLAALFFGHCIAIATLGLLRDIRDRRRRAWPSRQK